MKKQDEMWTMKDGTKIAVGDMTEQHVRNTLRLLIRTNEFIKSGEYWIAIEMMESLK